jgi:uncharacterized RDD family membrane protein YckC
MMNDSVREDLRDKITPIAKPFRFEIRRGNSVSGSSSQVNTPKNQVAMDKILSDKSPKKHTTEILSKPTNQTLVEFQSKNAAFPEWRLQVQNAVRKRKNGANAQNCDISSSVQAKEDTPFLATDGSVALKIAISEDSTSVMKKDRKLKNALQRIEASRRKYLIEEKDENLPKNAPLPAPARNYPFYVASKNAEVVTKPSEIKSAANTTETPKQEEKPLIGKKGYDTNKLRPLPNSAIISLNIEKTTIEETQKIEEKKTPVVTISRARSEVEEETEEKIDLETADFEETEELATLSMRFNAGLFDLIIGIFTSLILLAPLMISGGNWFSLAGFLAFLVTCAIVMFIYLTIAVGFFGQTFGMRIFSLEIIDIEEEEYPTLHQAAVNSAVYLLSLVLGGIGFIPALFNEEKRAAHDLLSGTVVVKGY